MKYLDSFFKLYTNSQFIRYLSIGSINTFVGVMTYPILFYILYPYNFNYIDILYLSFLIATSFSFVTNKFFVFKSKSGPIFEYFKFISIHIIFLLINVFALKTLVDGYKYHPVVSQLFLTFIIIFIGYYYNKLITFRN